ncbi:hypothetical protein Tco_1186964, partial [Tanacetum coccineum]
VKQQPDGIFISQDKYVADILKKFDFLPIRTTTTPIESNKPLVKDEDGVDVDVHVYRSMIAVCACASLQVNSGRQKLILKCHINTGRLKVNSVRPILILVDGR